MRFWVVHRDTTPAIINQMLKVEMVSKHKFTGIKADKEGIKELLEHERLAKRMKALDDRKSITNQSEYSIVLSGIKSSSKATKIEESTSKGGGSHEGEGTSLQGHKQALGRGTHRRAQSITYIVGWTVPSQ